MRRITALPAEVKARYDLSSLACTVANAAPWTMALKHAYLDTFRTDSLWEVYGSTELSVVTALPPEDQLRKPGSCGRPIPGVEVILVGEDGDEIAGPDVPGELYVRSSGLLETYHNQHERYLENHRDGFQTVGDIAYRDAEGYFYICDRKGDMIITGGVNVYPAEIENVLDHHPAVREVAVLGLPDEEWGEAVCAVVVVDREVDPDELIAYARERLSGAKTPKRVVFVDEMPATATGKPLKRELRTRLTAG
jgi:fatty-acyl-CoA synthase/long-chain acyl-CoA synthetase